MIRILIVDDEPIFLPLTKTFLEKDNDDIECDTCTSAQEALEKLAESPYDVIVSDYDMPGMDGIALLTAVRRADPDLPFILLTGRGREEVVIEALNLGADFYLQKSADPGVLYAELASKIRHAVDRRRAREALKRTQFSIDHLSAEFYWIDHEGCLIDVNEYACRKLGYTRDELFAMRVPDVDPDFAIEGFEEAWQEAWQDLKEHQTLRIESHHKKRDGTVYPVELSLNYCQMGEKEFMCAYATDITERNQAEKALRRSESRYRTLVENIHDVVYSYSLDGHITYISPNVQTYFGYTPSEMIGHSLFEYIHPEDREAVFRDFQRTITTSEEFTTHCRLIQKDGRVIHVEEIARKVVDEAGTVIGYFGVIRDVTEGKQAEEALRESEERYRAVVENSLDSVYRLNLQAGFFDYLSPVIEQITGFTPDEINAMSIEEMRDRIHPDDRRSLSEKFARAVASGRGIHEYRFRAKDGHYRWLADHFTVLRDRDGQPLYRGGVVRDVTGRKRTEEALRKSEERFRVAQEISPDGFTILRPVRDIDGNVVDFTWVYENDAIARLNGTDPTAVIGKSLLALFPGHQGSKFFEMYVRTAVTGETSVFEEMYQGETITNPTWFRIGVVRMNGDIAILAQDITERKRAEEALRKSEEKYRELFESMGEGFVLHEMVYDEEGTPVDFLILDINPAYETITGFKRDEIIGQGITEVISYVEPIWFEHYNNVVRNGVSMKFEEYNAGLDMWFGIHAYPVHRENRFAVMFTDITERKQAELALKDASRKLNLLTSITRHDILNQTTALKGFLALLEKRQYCKAEAGEMLCNLENIADTIRRQITFTGDYQEMGERDPEWQQVKQVMMRAAKSVRLNEVALAVDTGPLEIFADPMVEKVFYNLLDNAVFHGEGVKHISLSFHGDGDTGILVFEDDGVGVPVSIKDKIFERGFGKVTGYGLFLVKEILDITGIVIRETGEEGKGARFEIKVPPGKWRMAEH